MMKEETIQEAEAYIHVNPEHSIMIQMNVQHSHDDRRLRVTINHRQGPYKPKLLGVYVVDTVKEALARLNATEKWDA